MPRHAEIDAVLHSSLGGGLVASGRPLAAADAFAAAAAHGLVAGTPRPAVVALGQCALLAAVQGDLVRASQVAQRALRLSAVCDPADLAAGRSSHVALAYVHTERYELPAARSTAARAAADGRGAGDDPLATVVLALATARLSRADGQVDEALEVLTAARRTAELPPWLAELLRREALLARAAGEAPASGAREPALSVPVQRPDRDVLPPSGTGVPAPAPVDGWVWSAGRHLAGGRAGHAVQHLQWALRVAAPHSARRPFWQAPREVRALLEHSEVLLAANAWLTVRPSDRTDDTHVVGSSSAPALHPVPSPRRAYEPLTDVEAAVLRRLDERWTAAEIAQDLSVSVATVRRHVRQILPKLAPAGGQRTAPAPVSDRGLLQG